MRVVDDAFAAPGEAGFDLRRPAPEDDHHLPQADGGEGVEDVLEDRSAVELGELLATAEATPGPGRQDHRADPSGMGHRAAAKQPRMAAAARSTSASLVDQPTIEIRIAARPCQVVPPSQVVPSSWTAPMTARVTASSSAKRTRT